MMKEAEYTMEKVNDEYKLKEVVDGVAQFVGDSISSIAQGEIIGSWGELSKLIIIILEKIIYLLCWQRTKIISH